MSLFRCLLLFALILAVSANFSHRSKGKCVSRRCGLTRKQYVRPGPNSGKCLGVFGFLFNGLNVKLKTARSILSTYSNIRVSTKFDDIIETCVNLSRGIGFVLNEWIDGLGTIFENLIIGCTRCIFCVLRSPWENGQYIDRWFGNKRTTAPVICNKDFGVKWGWRKYAYGYSSRDEIFKFYNLANVRVDIETLIEVKTGIKIKTLTGTRKLIINTLLKLAALLSRDFKIWKRDDYVLISRYLITISASIGSGYRVGTGKAVIEEFVEYLQPAFKSSKFEVEISSYQEVITEEVSTCDTFEFREALVVDSDIQVTSSDDDSSSDGDD